MHGSEPTCIHCDVYYIASVVSRVRSGGGGVGAALPAPGARHLLAAPRLGRSTGPPGGWRAAVAPPCGLRWRRLADCGGAAWLWLRGLAAAGSPVP